MSMQALNAQQRPSLLARYQPKGGSQDPLGTATPVGDNPVHPITKSTSQRSLQNSSLLQRYQPRPLGSAATTAPGRTPSQRSLDQSKLLRRYYQPHSLDDGQSPASPSTPADSTHQLPQPAQHQRYSSQKSLEGSKLLQRYSNPVNNSQEFTGLSGRESTPVAGFARAASLEPERSVQRSSLLSKYTPRFGKSLDRNQAPPAAGPGYSGYGSQQHLPQRAVPERAAQSLASSRAEIADYGADHFDQYRDSAVRSRSSSVSRGGPIPKKGATLPRGSLRKIPAVDAPPEWAPPVTTDTLPVVGAVEEPVVGSIASALPLPMVSVIPPTPAIAPEVGSAPLGLTGMLPTTALTPAPAAPVVAPAAPPIKPVRKDLPAQHIVSIAIPNITTALAAPSVKQSVSKPKEPSPPLFSTRDRLDHYGSASNPDPAPSSAPTTTTRLTKTTITTLQLPAINDLSSRRSITDLRGVAGSASPPPPAALEVSEFTDRAELRQLASQRHHHAPIQHTLASAFEQLAGLSVPQAKLDDDLEERIEAMPPDRKLKKRDFTYHPTFVPKQSGSTSQAEKRAHEEDERHRREDEKRRREDERRARDEEDRARKDAERQRKEDERRARDEEKRKEREEKKRLKDEKKKQKAAGKGGPTPALPEAAEVVSAPAEEMMDLASHLDHYSVATMQQTQQQQRSVSLGRPRSSAGGTPHGSHGALGRGALSSSYQSLDRASASSGQRQSKLLQRYGPKAGSQEALGSAAVVSPPPRELHRSQGSLDHRKAGRASLLDKYTPRPLSASTAVQPRSTSQRSLERSSLLQRYKPGATPRHDPYEHRDHEYEPIGDPVDAAAPPAKPSRLLPDQPSETATGQERKHSNASFLRVPPDEGDTISMEELQRSIEDRYFNLPTPAVATTTAGATNPVPVDEGAGEPSVEGEPKSPGKVKAAMAKAQSSGRQAMAKAQTSGRQAMAKAQEGSKNLQKKLLQQTDRLKTKMSHMKTKKPGEVEVQDAAAPLASPEAVTTPELEQLDFTLATPQDEEPEQKPEATDPTKPGHKFANRMKNIHMPKLQRPDFKRPEFTKKLPKLRGPDISMPKFKRPEMPKFLTERPDFGKMSDRMKLTRSRSLKETAPPPDGRASAASPSDVSTIGPQDDGELRTTKVNYTDFRTYPRLFDKLKRPKASAPSGQTSVRAGTPPPLEFTKGAKTTPHVPLWTSDKSSEDPTGSNRFLASGGSELDDRETSVERRMRQELERAEFEGPELAVTAEQRQLEEYDKENRAIHLLSAARHDEFLRRKPPMERQESDLASEEEKQFWASSLGQKIRQNIDMNSNDLDFLDEEERLLVTRENREAEADREAREQAQYLLELSRQREAAEAGHLDERRSSTPYTNQECQSSGSSGVRRRKGVLEEIDDDEFFLRQKGISKDNIQMGEYISSAIKEGLSQQPKNALADLDRYDRYYDDDERDGGLRRYYQPSFESDDVSSRQEDVPSSYGRTFPPDRPNRRAKKGGPMYGDEYGDEEGEEDLSFYDRPRRNRYGSEQPELLRTARYMDEDVEFEDDQLAAAAGSVVPPTPPTRRRKKRFRDVTPSDVDPVAGSNHFITAGSLPTRVATYRAAEEVPLAREESFGTIPTSATPSRERLRTLLDAKGLRDDNDDGADRVSRGAESLIGGIIDAAPGARGAYPYEVSENNGYAIVRKEAPPRPPAPMRRRKSTRSLDAPPSAPVRQFHTLPSYSVSPVRPQRNYSTISPNRPPRRKSVSSLTGSQQLLGKPPLGDGTPYEDVLDVDPAPASAPPRPPPPATKLKSGDVVNRMKDRPLPAPPRPTRKTRRPDGSFDHHQDLDGGAERVVSVGEVETATQTDPLSDDFGLDAEIAAVTAAASRATDTEVLEGALSRFRDGNARALSDRPKSSRSGSRPETPASILIERKVSTPSLTHESVVEASLTVQPLDGEFDDDQYIAELVKKYVSDEARKPEPRKTERSDRFRKSTSSLGRSEDPIDPVTVAGTSAVRPASVRSTSRTSVDGRLLAITPEPLRNVEISPTVIEEIVERLRTTEQHHIDELHRLHQQQLEDLRLQHEDQKRQQEQRLEQQQRQLLDQQSQQLNETQKLKEQIAQQQNQQHLLLTQQQNQQQLLLVAQQQQQLLMEQQEKERELQRDKERELLRERELELERARERERELHLAREAELQRAREVEQQRLRDLELQRAIEAEKARQDRGLRELELQRAIEAEQARHREQQAAQAAAQAAAREAAIAREPASVAVESQATQESAPIVTEPPTEGATGDVVDGATVPVVAPQEQPPVPVRPPLPLPPFAYHPDYLAYGVSPSAAAAAAAAASSYLMRANAPPSEEDGMAPLAPQRRRRHHRSRRESTSEDDQQLHQQRERRQHRHATRSPEPSIPSLGGQLMRACGLSLRQTGDDLMSMLRASSKDENKRDLHIAIIILIVIVAGLMALGMSGEKAVHHHHWDYFSPPGHGSSA